MLASCAAAWLLAGVFAGVLPKVIAVGAAVIGSGIVAASYRTSRPAAVQYLALPLALAAGAALMVPATTGGSANLPSLVAEAVRGGGLSQPPVPFEPGWRFLLLVLVALLAVGAAALATALDRPRLGIVVPLPVVLAAALVQPPKDAVGASIVAMLLLVAALILSSGAQLMQDGSSSGAFEVRRLLRGLAGLTALAVALGALSQAGFLFPAQPEERVIPPKRPQAQPPLSDRVLFTVESDDPGPWRFGVIDVYDETAWLLPPVDRSRHVEVPPSGSLAAAVADRPARDGDGVPAIPESPAKTRTLVFEVGDLPGRVLPTVEGQTEVREEGLDLELDPRTQTLRSAAGRAQLGSRYVVTAAVPPSATDLAGADDADLPAALDPFLEAPEPPSDVATLLAAAPEPLFERLQFVRNALYSTVIAAGEGTPVDVPPARVAELLSGAEATPYEITAAEALLARWAGVPARIGFGFFSGTPTDDGAFEVHPRDGATWLEAYFHRVGWITIVGKPPRAKPSTDLDQKNQDPQLRASEDLALVVRVPVELTNLRQLYDDIRFYLLVSLPWVLLAVLAIVFYPAGLKLARRWRRRRWARGQGLPQRLLVAYADLRDRLRDVHAPNPAATPLEFLSCLEPDEEHAELAWLVTRALWGDLRRDLRLEDVEAAEDMAASVGLRALRAQRPVPRLLGLASRTSLRDPFTRDVPNLWPSGERARRVRTRLRRLSPLRPARALTRGVAAVARGALPRLRRGATGTATTVVALLVMTLLGGCGQGAPRAAAPSLPDLLVPDVVGDYRLQREPSAEAKFDEVGDAALVTGGRVYTVRRDGEVLGSLQAATFKEAARGDRKKVRKVQKALRASIGTGDFVLQRIGTEPVYVLQQNELKILLWFPPGGGYYEILDARQGFDEAEQVFLAILNFQRGRPAGLGDAATAVVDIRRGGD